jgi:hypothetical protein
MSASEGNADMPEAPAESRQMTRSRHWNWCSAVATEPTPGHTPARRLGRCASRKVGS